jgi:hypothetical protein
MNSFWLSLDPLFSGWVIAPVMLLLSALLFWKEFRRRNKLLVARLLANVLLLISIFGILLQPSYPVAQNTDDVILLTKDYDAIQADSLLKKVPGLGRVVGPDAVPYPESKQLASYQDIESMADRIRYVMGNGLPPYALELIGSRHFSFVPSKLPAGIVKLMIPEQIVVNKKYKIKGSYKSVGHTRLRLVGPAGAADSVEFVDAGIFPFELSFKASQPGRFVYRCVETASDKNEKSYDLPLLAEPERQLRMLFIQKFPTAEVRQLKNYLAEKGHGLAIRYQVSRNTYNYEYANLDRIRIDRLTPDLLATFDLIFIDSDVLSELGDADRNGLYEAVRQGLGLTLLLNELPKNPGKLSRFFPPIKGKSDSDTVHIRLLSEPHILPVLPVEIRPDPSIQVVTSHRKRILSGYRLASRGKIAFQLLRETYRIRLAGNESDYSSVWTELVERTARKQGELFNIQVDNQFPVFTDEPMNIRVLADGQQPTLLADGDFSPLGEDVMIDDLWRGKIWAGGPGWHQLTIKEDSTRFDYFVSKENDWSSLRAANQIRENGFHDFTDGSTPQAFASYESKRISPLLFFIAFLIASAFLWLAPKI